MALPRPSSPRAVWRDLLLFLDQRNRAKWLFAGLSILLPALLIAGFYVDSRIDPPPLRTIYVQQWRADRTDAEIIAQQKIDGAKADAAREKKRQEWQRLEKRLGM